MLEIANLEVVYHSVVLVLKGVSLEVPEGGIVALLGPNGAGKTTTLRAITGLLDIHNGKITKGSIRYSGQDFEEEVERSRAQRVVHKLSSVWRSLTSDQVEINVGVRGSPELQRKKADAIVRSGIAQVMEGRRILADLTVEENLRAGAYTVPRAQANEDIQRFYERFPILGERRRQQAGYLSGGEQQMLAIARALMSRPKLLLLDEPSLGLAPKLVADVARLIKEINEDGMSILLVEQNAAMALDLADYGYVMETGKVVLDGTAAELKDNEDIQEFYLGMGEAGHKSYRNVKHYRRRKRWLS